MRFVSFVSAVFALAPLALAGSVIEATSDTFAQVIGNTPTFVKFYAPWCGHCKKLAPTWEELADSYTHLKGKINIIKVDADGEGKDIGFKYGVTGYPTLKWFPEGVASEPEDYKEGRELEDLQKFVQKKSGLQPKVKKEAPKATLILDADTFNDVALDQSKDVLVAFTAPWCGHCKAMKPTYEVVAKNFIGETNCVVANVDADAEQNKGIASTYEVRSFPTIKFFPKGGKAPVEYQKGRSEADFTEFLNEHCGTYRAVGGGLNEKAGRVATLDSLASEFFTAVPTSRAELYDQAVVLGKDLGGKAAYYLKVMEKLVNGTENYVEKEAKRLSTILEKRQLVPKKLDEIKVKANILSAFVEKKVAEAVGGSSEHDKAEL